MVRAAAAVAWSTLPISPLPPRNALSFAVPSAEPLPKRKTHFSIEAVSIGVHAPECSAGSRLVGASDGKALS